MPGGLSEGCLGRQEARREAVLRARKPVWRPSWAPGGPSGGRFCRQRPSGPPGGSESSVLPTVRAKSSGLRRLQGRRRLQGGGVECKVTSAQNGLLTGLLAPKTASRRASWRARRLPTGLLAPQTASGWVSWRPRRPPDRPPGAQVGLWTGLLTPQTASDGPSPADKFTCRQDHLPTSPPASQVSPGAKRAFDACTFLPLTPYCRDSLLDKTAARRT